MGGKRWTIEEDNKLKRLINKGHDYTEIVDKFDRSIHSIRTRGNKLGLRIDKNVDYNFFDRKDEYSHYVLGYWLADGCIMKKSGGHYFSIVSNDRKHLIKIADLMKVKTKIYKNSNDAYELRVGNKKLINNLIKIGGDYRKTKTIKFDDLEIVDKYFYDFLRGYFEGDGGFQFSSFTKADGTNSISNIKFTGAEKIIKSLYEILNKGTCYRDYRKDDCFYLSLYSDEMKELLNEMYKNSNIHLSRKYKIYEENIAP